jgi:hypothetical protein
LSKAAVELRFSFNKARWANAAHTVVAADWIVEFNDDPGGRQVIALDPSTKVGLSIRPYFRDEKSPPEMVMIENYYHIRTLGSLSDEVRQLMEAITQEGLGGAYHVRLSFRQTEDHDVVQFLVTEL